VKTEEEKDPSVRVVDRRWWARGEGAEPDDRGARKPTYIEELEQRLGDITAQLQSVKNDHRRSLEEFEEVKGRLRRDVARDVERAKRGVLTELLDVVDNLDRALAAAGDPSRTPASDAAASVVRGVELVRDQFLDKLQGFGVTRVATLGQRFDAQRHEAVSTAPVDDPSLDGVVVGVAKEGYALGDQLLRPASVIVGKA
jgi:molecular chaperone GrpE